MAERFFGWFFLTAFALLFALPIVIIAARCAIALIRQLWGIALVGPDFDVLGELANR